jgi:hypothetical protein
MECNVLRTCTAITIAHETAKADNPDASEGVLGDARWREHT